jgi:fumarate hydratase class II
VQPGSSIMPGKVNPVLAEMLDMAMFHVLGCDFTVTLAAQAGQLELNVMMPIMAHNLFEMMQVMIGSLKAFTEYCVVGLKANPEKATGWLAKNAILVTALNPLIGYLKGAEIAKAAMARNITIREVALEKIRAGELVNKDTRQGVSIEEIDAILGDVRSLTDGGIHG